ncbi:YybH family protein [Roseateles cavernae]|uniref:YybH family protein n=1 Tax=Roseateles cavernae TaxID=3153578 RepID=UPI0032E3C376
MAKTAWMGALLMAAAPQAQAQPDLVQARAQVWAAECAFARSMAQRDLAAFAGHLSAQALFFNGPEVLRGSAAVLAGWTGFFDAPTAPFSWAPDQVEVLADGSLAYSTGLVRNPQGEAIVRFNSVWRQEAPGQWRVVLDKGSPLSTTDRAAAGASSAAGCPP